MGPYGPEAQGNTPSIPPTPAYATGLRECATNLTFSFNVTKMPFY